MGFLKNIVSNPATSESLSQEPIHPLLERCDLSQGEKLSYLRCCTFAVIGDDGTVKQHWKVWLQSVARRLRVDLAELDGAIQDVGALKSDREKVSAIHTIVNDLGKSPIAEWVLYDFEVMVSFAIRDVRERYDLINYFAKLLIDSRNWRLDVFKEVGTATCLDLNVEAAKNDEDLAFDVVAMAYAEGILVEKNVVEAERWYSKALDKGRVPLGLWRLGRHYEKGDGVEKDIRHAFELYEKSSNNDGDAYYYLGMCYRYGDGVEKNEKMAFQCFDEGAAAGDCAAQYEVGRAYFAGEWVDLDMQEAVRWYRMAANAGLWRAQNALGMCYACGEGVEQNSREAVKWVKMAAEKGYAPAQYNMGMFYWNGEHLKRDLLASRRWFERADENGLDEAKDMLGKLDHIEGRL